LARFLFASHDHGVLWRDRSFLGLASSAIMPEHVQQLLLNLSIQKEALDRTIAFDHLPWLMTVERRVGGLA
jgi:hypothetical protein